MSTVVREDSSVASLKVKGTCISVADEHGSATEPGMEVEPFFCCGVPVQLAEAAWFECYECGGEGLGDRKVGAVDAVEGAAVAGDWFGRVLECAVDV